MEYYTSMYTFGHRDIVKSVEKEWWGSWEGFIFPRNELNKLDHSFYHECVAICGKCDKDNRHTCQRFKLLHNELSDCWLWKVRRYSPSQPSYYKVFFHRFPEDECPIRTEIFKCVKGTSLRASLFQQ